METVTRILYDMWVLARDGTYLCLMRSDVSLVTKVHKKSDFVVVKDLLKGSHFGMNDSDTLERNDLIQLKSTIP